MDRKDWEDWWEIAKSDPAATFFHSPLWAEIAKSEGYEPAPQFFSLDQRNAVLPAVKRTISASKLGMTWNLTKLQSTFAGCYGGIIAREGLPDVQELYQEIEDSADIINVVSSPIKDEFEAPWDNSNDFTQLLDLSKGLDKIEDGFSKGRRRGIDSAREEGVTIREAESKTDWETFFEAYQESLERWDNPTNNYDWSLIEKIYELQQKYPEHISLWLACVDGDIASGAIAFYWNEHADYWHGASFSEYFDYNPNDLLQYSIIEDAVDKGYRWYDFNPSGGHEGVIKFKEKFGPERKQIVRSNFRSRKLEIAKSAVDSIPGL